MVGIFIVIGFKIVIEMSLFVPYTVGSFFIVVFFNRK